ncbi:MAG: site-specific integrase [Patescibacteria group bacterium]|nr:site-specific integrase [Patescibacteria group bacterium]
MESPEEGGRRREQVIRLGPARELKTRHAARLEADRRLELIGITGGLQGRRATFQSYAEFYLSARVAILKPSSRAAFKSYARHLQRELKGRYLDELTVGACQSMVARLFARKLSRATIQGIVQFLRRLQRSARQEGIATIVLGPRDLALPKETRSRRAPRAFSIDETRRILAAAPWPWKALFALQAYLGLRAGEALGIEWSAIDFEAQVIQVRQQASHGALATTKSRNSSVPLPLPYTLAQILREYRTIWTPNDQGLLFANREGRPLWANGIRRNHLQPLLERLGIAPAGFHAWRHALATQAFRAGVGAAAVRQLLRHGSILVTMRYSQVSFDDLVAGSRAIEAQLAGPDTPPP